MVLEEKVREGVEGYRPQIIDALIRLLRIPTENPPGRFYRRAADYLSERLREWQLDHEMVTVPDGKYPRFSLIGEYGEGSHGLHFHGHYDVVPADSPEQFHPRLKEDRLYGRGSSDMKGGLVVILFALRMMKEWGGKLKGKVSFSLVPDEETGGFLGTDHLVHSDLLPRSSLGMLMPEPTSGVIWNANRGALTLRIEVMGKSSHVGLEHQGENAFESMLEVARTLLKLKMDIRERKTAMKIHPPGADRSVMLLGGESGSGISFNVVPERAFFTLDRRINPEENLDEARKELLDVLEEKKRQGIKIKVRLLQEGDSSRASTATPLASALKKAVSDVTGSSPRFELCPGLCEIRYFNQQSIPAYAYGPGLLEVSHGPGEYVEISRLLSCTAVYVLTAFRLLSAEPDTASNSKSGAE